MREQQIKGRSRLSILGTLEKVALNGVIPRSGSIWQLWHEGQLSKGIVCIATILGNVLLKGLNVGFEDQGVDDHLLDSRAGPWNGIPQLDVEIGGESPMWVDVVRVIVRAGGSVGGSSSIGGGGQSGQEWVGPGN